MNCMVVGWAIWVIIFLSGCGSPSQSDKSRLTNMKMIKYLVKNIILLNQNMIIVWRNSLNCKSRSIHRLELSKSSTTIDSSFGEAFWIIDCDRFIVWRSFPNHQLWSIHYLEELFKLSITIDSSFRGAFQIINHDRFIIWRSFSNRRLWLIHRLKELFEL